MMERARPLVVAMLCALIERGESFSSGGDTALNAQTCDAINVCGAPGSGGDCPVGMTSVAPPERTTAYHIRTAQGATPSTDPSTYTPGDVTTIWITVEVAELQMRYRRSQYAPDYVGRPTPKFTYACYCNGDPGTPSQDRVRELDSSKEDCGGPTDATHCGAVGGGNNFGQGCIYLCTPPAPPCDCSEPKMATAKYLGLLLYAVDANENKVGAWEIPFKTPPQFWTPPDSGCGGKAVMQADATLKGNVHSFAFRAPDPGVGTITFRALIKHGNTNMGSFFWPTAPASATPTVVPGNTVSGGDLTLTEGASSVTQTWHKATALGQSCDDVCAAQSTTCDLAALQAAKGSPQAVQSATKKYYTASEPAVAGCGAAQPAITDTPEQWLFFHRDTIGANTCPTAGDIAPPSCSAVPQDDIFKMRRLCPCVTTRRRLRTPVEAEAVTIPCPHSLPTGPSGGVAGCPHFPGIPASRRQLLADGNSAGSPSTTMPLLLTAIAALQLYGGANSAVFTGAALLLTTASLIPQASAHNWIWNPTSRTSGTKASTTKPCRSKKTNVPDVHVNPGQEFEMEWSSGHGGCADGTGGVGSGMCTNTGFHYFTIINALDADKLGFLTKDVITEYIEGAPSDKSMHLKPYPYWEKRHLSWTAADSSENGGCTKQVGATSQGDKDCGQRHVNEGKVIDTDTIPVMVDDGTGTMVVQTKKGNTGNVNYIQRSNAAVCRAGMLRSTASPESGNACYEPQPGVHQWTFPASSTANDDRVVYTNTKYPWIVSAHRFGSQHFLGQQADIARFKIDSVPGEYIVHWLWKGYADCSDVAVLPDVAGQQVPHTSDARYGIDSGTHTMARIDHCLYGGGGVQNLDFGNVDWSTDGTCSDNPIIFYNGGKEDWNNPSKPNLGVSSDKRTCYVIPPPGKVNNLGETREEALYWCMKPVKDQGQYSRMLGVNIVPLNPPPLASFATESICTKNSENVCLKSNPPGTRAIPYGHGNCKASCFAGEDAQSQICYPLGLVGSGASIGEDWTIVLDDPTDEIWYSTCFRYEPVRTFEASYTHCMDSAGTAPPICAAVKHEAGWRQGRECISCADKEYNSLATTQLPVWNPVAPEDCAMCEKSWSYATTAPTMVGQTKTPSAPPTTKAPAVASTRAPTPAPIATSTTWSSPGGEVTVAWEPAASGGGYTFTVVCVGCTSANTGWVALGINPTGTMVNTNAVRWRLSDNSVDETVNSGYSAGGVGPASVVRNIRDVAADHGTKTLVFTTAAFGASSVATSGTQQFVWAYRASGGFLKHDGKGSMEFSFGAAPLTEQPTKAPTKQPTKTPTNIGDPPTKQPTKAPTNLGRTSTPTQATMQPVTQPTALAPTATLCETSSISKDIFWGTSIVQCAESTASSCTVYEQVHAASDATCDGFCKLYDLVCTTARHDSDTNTCEQGAGSFACDETPEATTDHVCTCVNPLRTGSGAEASSNGGVEWTPTSIVLTVIGATICSGILLAIVVMLIALISVKIGQKIEQSGKEDGTENPAVGFELTGLSRESNEFMSETTRAVRKGLRTPPSKPPRPGHVNNFMDQLRDMSDTTVSELTRIHSRGSMTQLPEGEHQNGI